MAQTKHGTLTASQVDIDLGDNFRYVEVLMRSGDAELWAIEAGVAEPGTIAAQDNVDVVPQAGASVIIDSRSSGSTIVRLETAGTVSWSLKGIDP